MRFRSGFDLAAVLLLTVVLGAQVMSAGHEGTVKVGYVYIDHQGNKGVQQPTYNLYEGAALSLERFSYRFDDGTRINANLKNLTLNNRNLTAGMTKSGLYGVSFRNNQYRRTYSFGGDSFTRRSQTEGQAWIQPHRYVRLFGGYGLTDKHGRAIELFEPAGSVNVNSVDYTQEYFNIGANLKYRRSYATVEYRGSDYDNEIDTIDDRTSKRFRVTAVTPLPQYDRLLLNGGFQRFENEIKNRQDSLVANTVWGGLRFFYGDGYNLDYSFMFDRSRRTGDLSATDNVTHAVYAGKTWRSRGGITVGYRYQVNDDVRDEVTANGYMASAWVNIIPDLTVKAGAGAENKEVQQGSILTGDRDLTRIWGSVRYKTKNGSIRVQAADKRTENEEIGSTADFTRVASDVSLSVETYGQLQASYAFHNGNYENTGGAFRFREHIISGDLLSTKYEHTQVGVGGTYMRSQRDLDVESFQVKLTGMYSFSQGYKLAVVYSVFNFDDFDDPSPLYSRYCTANVVEISLSIEL
ncbi:MAG TPA: hypothetical protein VN285_12620 [Candidatus Deferrimicrobium sp.]|nr:hypothetical protein [Candidatus Deferrimicrobium sp.]